MSMGVANGLAALEAASAGTGPGNVAGSEKSGRASSRKLNLGIADESTAPKEPGIAGEGGCGTFVDFDCGISVNNEDGMDAKPSSLGRVLPNVEAGVF